MNGCQIAMNSYHLRTLLFMYGSLVGYEDAITFLHFYFPILSFTHWVSSSLYV
jgi:hypothetical protein